jgi:hypothetical protein
MNNNIDFNVKKCGVCKRRNNTLHWHQSPKSGKIWVYCVGKCKRSYSIEEFCEISGISVADLLSHDLNFEEAVPNEVRRMEWPSWYIPLSDSRAEEGVKYIKSRGLTLEGDMYYDLDDNGIVFPYHFHNYFVGAQTRFIQPRITEDGDIQKVTTIPGTRLGLLFYGWNQSPFVTNVKGLIVCEGAFNALSIQQSLNLMYGGVIHNPWKAIACSGANSTNHQVEKVAELKESGLSVVIAPDTDTAGLHMLENFVKGGAATHRDLTEDESKDWNDALKILGHKEFAKWFLSKVKKF